MNRLLRLSLLLSWRTDDHSSLKSNACKGRSLIKPKFPPAILVAVTHIFGEPSFRDSDAAGIRNQERPVLSCTCYNVFLGSSLILAWLCGSPGCFLRNSISSLTQANNKTPENDDLLYLLSSLRKTPMRANAAMIA